jgi:hypothetical protein
VTTIPQAECGSEAGSRLDIGRYNRDEIDALLAFRIANYGSDALRARRGYVNWLYGGDDDDSAERGSLFVCRSGGRIVGTQGLARVDLKAGEETVRAAWVIDFAVRSEAVHGLGVGLRGVGRGIALVARRDAGVRLAIDVTRSATVLGERAGWHPICTVPLWVRPLDVAGLLRARAAPRVLIAGADAGQLALAGIDRYAAWRARRHGIELVPTDAFDERADDVWSGAASHYPVVCRRDRRFLSWRFDRCVRPERYTRYWLMRAGRPVGYAVLRVEDVRGIRATSIIDYFCEPALAPLLLKCCLDVSREAGAMAVYCLHLTPRADRLFRPLGFLRRSSSWPFIAQTSNATMTVQRLVGTATNWFVTSADSNVEHARMGMQPS